MVSRDPATEIASSLVSSADKFRFYAKERSAPIEPKTPEEVWQYVHNVYGVRIPLKACSEETNAPFEAFYAVHRELHPYILILANRGGSKTYNVSISLNTKCRFRPEYEAVHTAWQKSQSSAAAKYQARFARDSVIGAGMEASRRRATWDHGASWEIYSSTVSGISGQHPNTLSCDELEFWSRDNLDQAYPLPVARHGYRASWVGFSTRQTHSGEMNRLVALAEHGESASSIVKVPAMKLYQWSMFETMRPCKTCLCIKGDRVLSHPETHCALWKFCKGIKGRRSDGWIPREMFLQLASVMSEDAFAVQFACEKPTSHGQVFHNFVPMRPTRLDTYRGNHLLWTYKPELPVYAVHDPGEGAASALALYQIYDDCIFFFAEIVVERQATVGPMKLKLWELCTTHGYALPEYVVVDPHRPDAGEEWRGGSANGHGDERAYRAVFPNMERNDYGVSYNNTEPGYMLVRAIVCSAMGRRRLFVNDENAPKIARALADHKYKLDAKTRTPTLIPERAYKDETDVVRYACIFEHQQGALTGLSIGDSAFLI